MRQKGRRDWPAALRDSQIGVHDSFFLLRRSMEHVLAQSRSVKKETRPMIALCRGDGSSSLLATREFLLIEGQIAVINLERHHAETGLIQSTAGTGAAVAGRLPT